MSRQFILLFLLIALLTTYCTSREGGQESVSPATSVALEPPPDSEAFEVAEVRFEQNATDGDVEVVFEVNGGDAGLMKLQIVGPDGRIVADFTAPDSSTMGIRSFRMESPEPQDISALKSAYPEGTYKFVATDSEGTEFWNESTLSHTLPGTAGFLSPEEEAEGVPVEGLEISWTPAEGVTAYIVEVEIEGDRLDDNISVKLPGSATSFAVPENFLRSAQEYKIAIGTVSEEGNLSFVETTFVTAGEAEEEQ
jgi:hypothetical protein